MGRAYATELRELDATYAWAFDADVQELTHSVAALAQHDALFVGSGGSLTSAHFAAFLHEQLVGRSAHTLTAFELASINRVLADSSVLICSAGGSNPDVIAASEVAIKRAPRHLVAITTRLNSPLSKALSSAGWPKCHSFDTPTRKDGFLATNSLLATMVLLARAYASFVGSSTSLPSTLCELVHPAISRNRFLDELRQTAGNTLSKATIVVLHGASTTAAAMDVESRFTEAALASVQPADYRNFAHGRHHWLAKHGASTGVIAFGTTGDELARKTLRLIPSDIARCQITVAPTCTGALSAVCNSIFLGALAGELKGLDPGRPHVPTFGRRLYHLRAMPSLFEANVEGVSERVNLAIERQSSLPVSSLMARNEWSRWIDRYDAFVERLAAARIRAIVLDYDGTLCGRDRRLVGPSVAMLKSLTVLLSAGCVVAIATGRGKSVRETLRAHLRTVSQRRRVLVGYHNGAEIGSLADHTIPPIRSPLAKELVAVSRALEKSDLLSQHATFDAKGRQIAVEMKAAGDTRTVMAEVDRVVRSHDANDHVAVVTSSHSVDILAHGVTKLNVVHRLVSELKLEDGGHESILCIGDRGCPPGNDADLLRHPLSLSVDQVSGSPETCWNLAEPGLRFESACLDYLTRLKPTKGGFRFDVAGMRR